MGGDENLYTKLLFLLGGGGVLALKTIILEMIIYFCLSNLGGATNLRDVTDTVQTVRYSTGVHTAAPEKTPQHVSH